MLIRSLLATALFFVILSCAVQEKATEPSGLTYSMESIKKKSENCTTDTSGCTTFEVNYPVFSNLDSATAKLIKAKIDAYVSMGNPDSEGWPLEKIADEFIKGYEEFSKESPELATGSWYYKADINVETSVDTLISLSVNDEYFTGGAHGGAGSYFINVNPKNKKYFTLDNLLKPGYEPELTKEAEKAFRQVRELADTASFINNGFEFPENQFQLNENYGFTNSGITFVYNSYEVAPYAAGPTYIVVPYERLRDWLK
jgi:hypothetical protein